IAAAAVVDFAADAGSGLHVFDWSFEVVDDVTVFGVGDFGDAEFGGGVGVGIGGGRGGGFWRRDPAGVVDLSAAGGVEGGAVENERRARGLDDRADLGVEVVEEGVAVVEAVGHAWSVMPGYCDI